MREMRKNWPGWLLAGAVCASVGCSSQDADRLAHLGHRLAAKAQALTGSADGPVVSGWPPARPEPSSKPEETLDARVSARLHGDKGLANTEIRVKAIGKQIELLGKLETEAQRRRAVELAESTVGVEQVADSLEVPPRDP